MATAPCGTCGRFVTVVAESRPVPTCQPCRRATKPDKAARACPYCAGPLNGNQRHCPATSCTNQWRGEHWREARGITRVAKCAVGECEWIGRPAAQGYCPKHYARWRKHGTTSPRVCRYCPSAVQQGNSVTCGTAACRTALARDESRAQYRRSSGPPKTHVCTRCGTTLRAAWADQPVCRKCYPARIDPVEKQRNARHRKAKTAQARAARGTVGKRVWTQGSCGWCGEEFLRVGTAPARWCSDKCKRKVTQRRRCTAIHGGTGWTWSDFMRMARKFNYCCAYCGGKPDRLDPDHVIPLARGGPDSLSNILPTCMPCNSDKRDLLPDEWNADRARRGLEPRHTDFISPQFFHLALPSTAAA